MSLFFVAYYFPPLGLSGVLRSLKFVKYLARRGWDITVLSSSPRTYYAFDPSLLDELPESTEVLRTSSIDFHHGPGGSNALSVSALPGSLGRTISRFVFVPDSKIGWFPFAVRAGIRRAREHRSEVVMASGPPWTSFLVARSIAKSLDLPLVLDYRDSWLMDSQNPLPTRIHRALARRLERSLVGDSTGVIAVNESVRDELRERYPGRGQDIVTIYNGFDREDFSMLPGVESPFSREGSLKLIYLGTLYQDVNVPARLFRALAHLKRKAARAPSLREPVDPLLEIVFVGTVDSRFVDMVKDLDIADLVRFLPYRPHREALATLTKADAAILLVDPHEHADRHVPGKLYEYLGARIPVAALAPAGSEAARIVTENRAGVVFPPDDVQGISLGLEGLIRAKESGQPLPRISETALSPFDRKEQADALHAILDRSVRDRR